MHRPEVQEPEAPLAIAGANGRTSMPSALSLSAAVLASELGAAELVLGALVGAGFLLYPIVDFVLRHIPHRSARPQSQHA